MSLTKEVLDRLRYSVCDCEIDYRPELGIVNGVCPNHPKSILLIEDEPVKDRIDKVRRKLTKPNGIV